MGQLGKIHLINTRAYLESARHVMVEYGGYSDPEVDVLCEYSGHRGTSEVMRLMRVGQAYLADVEREPMYTR